MSATFLVLILLTGVTLYFILVRSYRDLEERELEDHTIRAKNSLFESTDNLKATLIDWAWWTDTYNFLSGNYDEFIDANIDPPTINNLALDFMWFSKADGSEHTGIMIDSASLTEVPFFPGLKHYFETEFSASPQSLTEVISGFIKTPEGLVELAATPVLTNARKGPYLGRMIIGRYIDTQMVEDLSRQLRMPVSISPVDAVDLDENLVKIKEQLNSGRNLVTQIVSGREIMGATLFKDIKSEPAFILSLLVDRNLFKQGVKTIVLLEFSLLLIAFIVLIAVVFLLDKYLIARLSNMGNQIAEIDIEGRELNHIEEKGADEISRISRVINALLKRVYTSRERLTKVQEELEQKIRERTRDLEEVNLKLSCEVSDRTRIQEDLIVSLKGKESLIKEIYHRSKNNMSALISLLRIQRTSSDNDYVKEVIHGMENRIYSMMLVNEKLHNTDNFKSIDLEEYFHDLSNSIVASIQFRLNKVYLRFKTEAVRVSTEFAIPCGLILNELLTNSMKYAYPNGQKKSLVVFLYPGADEMVEFGVKDYGIGFPENFDLEETTSLGLNLVKMLAREQLGGVAEYVSGKGIEWKIRFPLRSAH